MLVVIGAAATVVQTLVVVLGIRFAVASLRQNETSRNLEAIKALLDGMSAPEGYAERYAILDRGTVRPEELSREDYLLYLRTCDQFQRVCFLARQEFMSGDYLVRMFSATLVSLWGCVEEFARDVRTRRGLSNFAEDFGWFANRAATTGATASLANPAAGPRSPCGRSRWRSRRARVASTTAAKTNAMDLRCWWAVRSMRRAG